MSPDKNSIYYWEEHNKIWYYYNDFDHGTANGIPIKPNWYRTPVNYREDGWGSITFEQEGQKRLFYVGVGSKIHYVEWVNADNPIDCPHYPASDYNSYKTDETGNNNDKENIGEESDKEPGKTISISVFPNPSHDKFTIIINGLETDGSIRLKIESTDGKIIYSSFTSNTDRMTWDAGKANSGVYYYQVKINNGETISGKMVKM